MPNAVDLSRFAPDDSDRSRTRATLGIGEDQLLVGHIGRFVEQKNHYFLLDIFKSVLSLCPDAALALVGTGPLLEQVEDRARELGIDDSVLFLGNRTDAPSLYRAFDVFCLPSLYEGLPMVGVECQASLTPILASSAVTSEAAATPLMQFESLESSPMEWAGKLIDSSRKRYLPKDAVGIHEFDIRDAAGRLESFYLSV